MSILINEKSRVIVQGITGRDGAFHAAQMADYGTKIVGGVTPGKGGQVAEGIPVFDSCHKAVAETGADVSIIFVPAKFAMDAMCEAADAGIKLVVAVSEGVPTLDVMKAVKYLDEKGAKLIGPNSPGLISPGRAKVGILPGNIFKTGPVGLISRSGTLTYEIVDTLTRGGIGQSTCIGIGGDPIVGLHYIELLEMFENDPETSAVALIGEIGGDAEEKAAKFIAEKMTKPVAAFIAGRTAPPGKRMGHAGAIISSGSGTAEEKIRAFAEVGVPVADEPSKIADLIRMKME